MKNQYPRFTHQRRSKLQAPTGIEHSERWCLVFGIWCLFGAWCLMLGACLCPTHAASVPEKPRVLIQTAVGDIEVELDRNRAPLTVTNFLHYVREGLYSD